MPDNAVLYVGFSWGPPAADADLWGFCGDAGTTTTRGVCLLLRQPVPGIDPLGVIRHPGLTLTVANPQRFAAIVRVHAGLPASGDAPPA